MLIHHLLQVHHVWADHPNKVVEHTHLRVDLLQVYQDLYLLVGSCLHHRPRDPRDSLLPANTPRLRTEDLFLAKLHLQGNSCAPNHLQGNLTDTHTINRPLRLLEVLHLLARVVNINMPLPLCRLLLHNSKANMPLLLALSERALLNPLWAQVGLLPQEVPVVPVARHLPLQQRLLVSKKARRHLSIVSSSRSVSVRNQTDSTCCSSAPGDRSHIPEEVRPAFNVLSEQLGRLRQTTPVRPSSCFWLLFSRPQLDCS